MIAVILLAITIIVLWFIVGIRVKNDKVHEVKFVGRVVDGVPVSGRLYYYDGRKGKLDAEAKTIEMNNGEKYVGALSGYLPHGKGILTKADGSVLEGDFYEGYCTGNAIISYKNGNSYIGEVDHENPEGRGEFVSGDGTVYTGDFRNCKMNGFGITRNPDGSVYIGQYKDDIKQGYGAYLFEFGDIFVGVYDADRRHGKGIYIWANSEEYLSEFEKLFDVTLTAEFESSFLSYFENGFLQHFNGEEVITSVESENTFIQEFEAILSRNQIECYIGEFDKNVLNGVGYYRWLSGRTHYGPIENGVIDVSGTNEPEAD